VIVVSMKAPGRDAKLKIINEESLGIAYP